MQDVFSFVGYQCVSQVGIMSAERSVATESARKQNSAFIQHSCKGIFEHWGKVYC